MTAEVWYCTREQVKSALDSKETARNNPQIDRLIAAAADSIENDQLYRRFYPEIDTRSFAWPCEINVRYGTRTLSLGIDELVSVTELTVDGTAVDEDLYTLLPVNDGPPYTHVELDSSVTSTSDDPRPIQIAGVFGYWDREDAAGALAAAVSDTSSTTVTVTDSSTIGVGQLLTVGDERMIVDGKSMVDTAQNTTAALTASVAGEVVAVGSGSAFTEGEVILVDAEKMLVVEIAGNSLIVKRPWDGSTLAAHDSGADVYAPRQLTVRRGVLGTTATTHASAAAVTKHAYPELVRQLCIAEAQVSLMQENTGWGRVIGSGDAQREAAGKGLSDLRDRAWLAHGRKAL